MLDLPQLLLLLQLVDARGDVITGILPFHRHLLTLCVNFSQVSPGGGVYPVTPPCFGGNAVHPLESPSAAAPPGRSVAK